MQFRHIRKRKKKRQIRRWIIVAATCVFVTAALASFKFLQIRKAILFAESFPEHSETVETVVAKQIQWAPTIKVMGEVKAPQSVELRNELEGRIATVGFTPGANVTKDQLLIQFDVSQELAQLTAAKAQAKLATLELDRYKRLIANKLASKDQYDQAKAKSAVTKAEVQSLKAIIDKKTLKAPFNAKTGLHELEAGQFLASNTLITQLVGISENVWVDFSLPQEHATLAIGTPISANAPGLLDKPVVGSIIAKDAAVTQQSRNMRFRAVFNQVSTQLKPGAIVEITLSTSQKKRVTVLPMTSVRRDQFGANVYALVSEQSTPDQPAVIRAKKRLVKLGAELDDKIIITEGVHVGERIAAAGAYKLQDAMLVNINPVVAKGQPHE